MVDVPIVVRAKSILQMVDMIEERQNIDK